MADNELIYDDDYIAQLESDDTPMSGEIDLDADYAAPGPPLPDAWHMLKLKNIGAKVKDKTSPYYDQVMPFVGPRSWGQVMATFFTQIEGQVVEPGGPQDGKRTNRFNVTTHPEERRNNSSSASLVYRAITGKTFPTAKPASHMALVVDELKGQEPIVWAKTQLEGEASDASKAYVDAKEQGHPLPKKPKTFRGQDKFKFVGLDSNGNPIYGDKITGVAYDLEFKERVVGRPQIVDLKPQSFTPPGK